MAHTCKQRPGDSTAPHICLVIKHQLKSPLPWRRILDAAIEILVQSSHSLSEQSRHTRKPSMPCLSMTRSSILSNASNAVWGWERHQIYSMSQRKWPTKQRLCPQVYMESWEVLGMEMRHIIAWIVLLLQQFVFVAFSAILFSNADLALPFYPAVLCITIYFYSIPEATCPTIMQMLSSGSATMRIASEKLPVIPLPISQVSWTIHK